MFGTEYKFNQFVLLPDSTNAKPSFGKIKQLLCSQENGYLRYKKTSSVYMESRDLFMICEIDEEDIILVQQLSDYYPLEGSPLFLCLNIGDWM